MPETAASVPLSYRNRSASWIELLILVVLIAALGAYIARAHWGTIWMDPEFTGWVAPVSNSISTETRLYADGLHSPMPPVPFLIVHWLKPGNAVWMDESILNTLARLGSLPILYLAFCRLFPRPVPFLATLLTLPIFAGFPKTIFYDALVQLLVALALLVYVAFPSGTWLRETLLGGICATALLTKQSTGLFLTTGTALALAFLDRRRRPWRQRFPWEFLAALLVTFAAWLFILLPWVSARGLLIDVFLTGSEPKGGALRLLRRLGIYGVETAFFSVGAVAAFLIGTELAGDSARAAPHNLCEKPRARFDTGFACVCLEFVALAAVVPGIKYFPPPQTVGFAWSGADFLWVALLTVFLSILWGFVSPTRLDAAAVGRQSADVALIALFAAVGHSLSVENFRWAYDNNPLIAIAIACLLAFVLASLSAWTRRYRFLWISAPLIVGLISLGCWTQAKRAIFLTGGCTLTFSEIPYVADARLPKHASAFRALAARIQELAPDAGKDEVLLLPDDPNLEAWWGRQRPRLTSAIVFVDQYWDRYVDEDIRRLLQHPPKVVIIGPRLLWRPFFNGWQHHWGAERLIDEVQAKLLLPEQYSKEAQEFSRWDGSKDGFDIYVRRGGNRE